MILVGDVLEMLRTLESDSVDSIVTDPPYELGFMGKAWDASGIAYSVEMWREAMRVLKPGGHLLAFSGSRTYHRMACAIEDAGFEIRDQIMWVYGSGFPKSLDVSKAIDKMRDDSADGLAVGQWLKERREERGFKQKDVAALWPSVTGGLTGCVANWETLGKVPKWDQWLKLKEFIGFGDEMDAEVWRLNGRKGKPGEAWEDREVVGERVVPIKPGFAGPRYAEDGITGNKVAEVTLSATPEAKQWEGFGTALKPAIEPLCVAVKPTNMEPGIIDANLLRLESRLWLLLSAKHAESSSKLSQSEYAGAFAIAQWTADDVTSTLADLSDQMDTSLCEWAIRTSLNTVSSWRRILGENLAEESTSTTGTESSTTIDWKTLRFCSSRITLQCMLRAALSNGGPTAYASPAAQYFSAVMLKLSATRTLSAVELATSQEAQRLLDVDADVAHEPVCMARKPFKGTVAQNVLEHGTGALNIDGCRIETEESTVRVVGSTAAEGWGLNGQAGSTRGSDQGRWPANFIHDGSDEVVGLFPDARSAGDYEKGAGIQGNKAGAASIPIDGLLSATYADSGSAARFFYSAKASKAERGEFNHHPTVKPIALMRYLCRLVTPPGGTVLDLFAGSGSTGCAAKLEGFKFVLIEREPDYVQIIEKRLSAITPTLDFEEVA